ncbi:DUF6249 domain-containing protein [candidate division KSB1 bacterium]
MSELFQPDFAGPVGFFLIVALIVKWALEHRIKSKLIDKGVDTDTAKMLLQRLPSPGGNYPTSLKWGLVLIAIGAAFLISEFSPRYWSDYGTLALVFIFAGAALIVYYFIELVAAKKQQ